MLFCPTTKILCFSFDLFNKVQYLIIKGQFFFVKVKQKPLIKLLLEMVLTLMPKTSTVSGGRSMVAMAEAVAGIVRLKGGTLTQETAQNIGIRA